MSRTIPAGMTAAQAEWLERPTRQRQDRQDLLIGALGLKEGQNVVEVGCGAGYLARRMAKALGSASNACAVNVEPAMLGIAAQLDAREGIDNMETRVGFEADVGLPAASFDLALLADTYNELSRLRAMLASVVRSLKPGVGSSSSNTAQRVGGCRYQRCTG